jgi:hypothetical protein
MTTSTILSSLKKQLDRILSEGIQLQKAKDECVGSLNCPNKTNSKHVYLECIKPDAKCIGVHGQITEIDEKIARNKSQNRSFWQQLFFECRRAIRKNDLEFFDHVFEEFTAEYVCNYTEFDGENVLFNAVVLSRVDIVKKIMPFTKKETINSKIQSIQKSALDVATAEIKKIIEA